MDKDKLRAIFKGYRQRIAEFNATMESLRNDIESLNYSLDCYSEGEARLSRKLRDAQYNLQEAERQRDYDRYEAEEKTRKAENERKRIEEERDYYERKARRSSEYSSY